MNAQHPQANVWDFMRGAMMTRALGIAAELGVADTLSEGPRPVGEIARETAVNSDSLQRVLRALASDGIFAEVEPGVFRNTDASELLQSGKPDREFARLFAGIWFRTVGDLDVGTDEASFPKAFGTDFWSWLAEHPRDRAMFDLAMTGGSEDRVERLQTLDWRGDETVVDVGGGNGSLLVALLRRLPGLRGVVFDLPETDRDESWLGERIEFVAGSFFESVPRGDVYILGTVLHDWNDERAAAILDTIRRDAPSGARIAIIDSVIAQGNEPDGAKWLDLLMLALLQGRERTEPEWRALIERAGLRVDSIESGLIQAIAP
jgi:hypothetical protein